MKGAPLRNIPEDYLKFLLDNHPAGKMKTKLKSGSHTNSNYWDVCKKKFLSSSLEVQEEDEVPWYTYDSIMRYRDQEQFCDDIKSDIKLDIYDDLLMMWL